MLKKILAGGLVLALIFVVYYWYQLLSVETDIFSPKEKVTPSSSTVVVWGDIKKPETEIDTLSSIDYAKAQNKDTVGWLRIPNTTVNYAIMQSDNNAYYLNNDEKRTPSVFGSCFLDYECSVGTREELSSNTIIYGHSDLKDNPEGQKFSQLFKFTDENFATDNPYIYFSTTEEEMVWEIFAVSYTDTSMKYIYPDLKPDEIKKLTNEAKSKSIYNYDVAIDKADKIITLSTCTVKYGPSKDQRLVVMAKLLPKDETLKSKAELSINPNPVEPKL